MKFTFLVLLRLFIYFFSYFADESQTQTFHNKEKERKTIEIEKLRILGSN